MSIPSDSELYPETRARREEIRKAPLFDHGVKIGILSDRSTNENFSPEVRDEAYSEILRYRDEGLALQRLKEVNVANQKARIPMTRSGFCAHLSENSHLMCKDLKCTCECHKKEKVYSGKGIIFAVIDDREKMREGNATTIEIITEAIEEALDNGYEDSESIARYITTNAFQHVRDRRVRFNSVLKASDVVGAQITRKLLNSYNELATMADESDDPEEKRRIRAEATGFAEAIQVVISPFSSEDKKDPRLIDWDAVDHMTDLFEKEQRLVRKERDGNPQ